MQDANITNSEWYRSRGIDPSAAKRIVAQLKTQYMSIRKAIKGEPTPGLLLELELVQMIHDVQQGRFPLKGPYNRTQE